MMFWKKEEQKIPQTYAIVDFSDEAKEFCAFDRINIIVKVYSKGQLVEKHWYSEEVINDLHSRGIPVVYVLDTSSCQMPQEMILFGRVKVGEIW